jgi:hypothetical protein
MHRSRSRPGWSAAAVLLAVCCLALADLTRLTAADTAPAPRAAGTRFTAARADKAMSPADLDRALIAEIKAHSQLMKNLQYLSDVIGPRLTGSKNAETANNWTAEKMKEYGLENVRLEPWEIPIGWQRGTARMRVIEPETNTQVLIASRAWAPGTKGTVTGPVVIVTARNKDDLQKYKGKLKNAVVLSREPAKVAPITDPSYGPISGTPKKGEGKKDAKKDEANKDDPKKDEAKKGEGKKGGFGKGGGFDMGFQAELSDFFKAEGVACTVSDSAKPHGLLTMTGNWGRGDRGGTAPDGPAQVFMAHESYAMLWRLASRPEPAVTKVEFEITNTFVPGPVVVYNTVGEIRGSEKPDEYVVVGAHLDSWDLGTGTTDNGTGSCVVLETARAISEMVKQGYRPKRTIRFCLFTGEEQGLHGSRQYVAKHKDEMPKTSIALVHDTGTGKVVGFGTHGQEKVKAVMDPELETLRSMEGWKGLDLGGITGSDHQSFHGSGVPGFACRQDIDEYRLTHHTQSDTFDHAKEPNLVQGAQVMAVTAMRVANLPDLLPRMEGGGKFGFGRKKDAEPKKDDPTKKDPEIKKPDPAPAPRSRE